VTPAPSLSVDLGGMILPTPVMIAAGCGGTGRELAGLVDLRRVGAVVSRTITVAERVGSDVPRIAESPAGVVWDTGLQNPGLDAFVAGELIRIARGGARIVVSIGGTSLEEYVRMTSALQGRPEVAAIEIHLSGPDDELDRPVLGAHPDRLTEIVGAVARMSLVPVFAKLPGASDDIVTLARTAIRAGATGVTLLASPPALGLDVTRDRPRIGMVRGWLSGPALKPITLRAVFDVAQAVPGVPVIASGGIRTGEDAVECLLAGAWAVQVGTATLTDPAAAVTVAQGIVRRLKAARLASPVELRGRLRPQEPSGADADADPDPVPAP
jgi:dihydroorotate dehydrogenase (NAD+) catalytic subunit